MKKKVLILTLNDYIIYQPSILNLYDFLAPHFDVTIVSFKPKLFTKKKDESRNIIYLQTNFFIEYFLQKFDFVLSKIFGLVKKILPGAQYQYIYYNNYLPHVLTSAVKHRKLDGDIIIAVDLPALKAVQEIFGAVHFLSLEIENNTHPIHKKFDRQKVKSVFIQSPERYAYLFPGMNLPTFYVQNAPVFNEAGITSYERSGFVWAGAISRRFAVLDCIRFFDNYPQYKLVLKGGADRKTIDIISSQYAQLINSGRIRIDQDYLPGDRFLDFLSHFRIGFCFYAWDIIRSSFNYETAPSGKLFMYLAAGVPVIACKISGFTFVEEYGAGILISDYEPETILAAVLKIESDYETYSRACYAAARHFSFDNRVAPYVDFLLKEDS